MLLVPRIDHHIFKSAVRSLKYITSKYIVVLRLSITVVVATAMAM